MSIETYKVPTKFWNHKHNTYADINLKNSGISDFLDYIFKKFNYDNLNYDMQSTDNKEIKYQFYSNNINNRNFPSTFDDFKKGTILYISNTIFNNVYGMNVFIYPYLTADSNRDLFTTKLYYTLVKNAGIISPCSYSFGVNASNRPLFEYDVISGIIATPNCISFEFRCSDQDLNDTNYDALKPSSYHLVLAKTKKGNWAIITPFATPDNVKYYRPLTVDNNKKIIRSTGNKYTVNNIVCYSLNSFTDEKFKFTPADLSKESKYMSFDTIPVLGDIDWVEGCYFNFYSNIKETGIIDADGKKYYYNGWLSMAAD